MAAFASFIFSLFAAVGHITTKHVVLNSFIYTLNRTEYDIALHNLEKVLERS